MTNAITRHRIFCEQLEQRFAYSKMRGTREQKVARLLKKLSPQELWEFMELTRAKDIAVLHEQRATPEVG